MALSMAEYLPVIMTGVQVGKKILEFLKKRREPAPKIEGIGEPGLIHARESIKREARIILENTRKRSPYGERLTEKQFDEALNKTIDKLSTPSTFYRDKLIEIHSVLNKGLGKIDLYYTLISRSSSKVKDIVVLQSRLLIPRINKDLNKFVAIMKQLDPLVLAEIQSNFCGAFEECESTLETQSTRLEDVQSVGADVSVSDVENWLHAYRDYIECCLEGVNKSITFA